MAEDKIKKQNEEQLNDEQLDEVAGGRLRPHNTALQLWDWCEPFLCAGFLARCRISPATPL